MILMDLCNELCSPGRDELGGEERGWGGEGWMGRGDKLVGCVVGFVLLCFVSYLAGCI